MQTCILRMALVLIATRARFQILLYTRLISPAGITGEGNISIILKAASLTGLKCVTLAVINFKQLQDHI